MALYTPQVDEIHRDGKRYELLVGYIPPATAWNIDVSTGKLTPDPHKYMIYNVEETDNGYRLLSIEVPPVEKQVQGEAAVGANTIYDAGEINTSSTAEEENPEIGDEALEDSSSDLETSEESSSEETSDEETSDENSSSDEETDENSESESSSEDDSESSSETNS